MPSFLVSYAGLEEHVDHLCIDGIHMRTLYISGYPFVANSGWMDSLINFNHDTDISYHLHEVSALSALPKLHRKITELESTNSAMMRAGRLLAQRLLIRLSLPSICEIRFNVGKKSYFRCRFMSAFGLKRLRNSTKQLSYLKQRFLPVVLL